MKSPVFPASLKSPRLFSGAAGALGGLAAAALLLGWSLAGFARAPLPPLALSGFLLLGAALWLHNVDRTARFRVAERLAAGVAVLAGAAAWWHPGSGSPAAAAGLVLFGVAGMFLHSGPGILRRYLPGVVVLFTWVAFLNVVSAAYRVTVPSVLLAPVAMPLAAAFLFLLLGAGILLARPEHGLIAVLLSPCSGGILARRLFPVILLLPFTIGWIRLEGLRRGIYDVNSGYTTFAATNILVFTVFLWFSSRMLNRLDARRLQAYQSLQEANLELRRVNEALQAKIGEQEETEEARKKVEAQLFQSQKMEAMGTLASGIAHDFNNILTVILLNAEMARETVPEDHPLQKGLHEIKKAGTRAAELIRQIMAFGRQNAGAMETLQLGAVVADSLEMLRHTLPSSVQLISEIPPVLPAVVADATQIQQVLLNLGTNAAHAMEEKGGTLKFQAKAVTITRQQARFSAELHEGDYVEIAVSDTGHGMDIGTVKKIFDPFFTTKPPGKGTGLGLSVVHGIMKLHGGSVGVYSEPERGTIFSLYFPAIAGAAVSGVPASRDEAPRGVGQRILCVDDDEAVASIIQWLLEHLGYRVTTRLDPAIALREFGGDPSAFDLIITDLSMPGMSGFELARACLSLRPSIPLILMSGYLRAEDVQAAGDAGVREVVLKPRLLEELGGMIHRLLSEKPPKA